jgi:hypothetical protein
MMVDTTVYGWLAASGEVLCADCAGLDTWSPTLARILDPDARPLYSIDDTEANGLSCEGLSLGCSGWVFEPCCSECYVSLSEATDLQYVDDEDAYLCASCRETRARLERW